MPTKPAVRVLLDVDGVLNAATREPDRAVWPDYTEGNCGISVCWSPTVVQHLCQLAENDKVEVLWLTTWEEMAQVDLAPLLGLPHWELAGDRRGCHEKVWWKLELAQKLWDRDHVPFVWLDDDLGGNDDGGAHWISSLRPNAMGIKPNFELGLTQRLLDEMSGFIAKFVGSW